MKDIQVFYNQEDKWAIPSETLITKPRMWNPTLSSCGCGEAKEEFMLMYLSPRFQNQYDCLDGSKMRPEDYGKLVVYQFPKKIGLWPQQIEARIDQDPVIFPSCLYGINWVPGLPGNLLLSR
jgi:uncharacterized membrane protein (UPF0182 family)